MRLDRVDYKEKIFDADLNDLSKLTKGTFEFTLCRFICEVCKVKDYADYPGRTLYQMTCALQNFLRKNNIYWKLVHGDDVTDFQRVLDNVMKERVSRCIGNIKKQAQVILLDFENVLWTKG